MSSQPRRFLRFLPLLLLVLAAGSLLWRQQQGPLLPVVVASQQVLLQQVVASGEVRSDSLVRIGSELVGVVKLRTVREGDRVAAGDLLLQLEDSEQQAIQRLEAARAATESDTCALVGPSGSGRSTLLNLLGLLDKPTSGELFLLGQPTRSMDDATRTARRNDSIGFVFQFHHLITAFTVLENVLMPLMIRSGKPTAQQRERALALLLADEPAGNLDTQTAGEVFELFRRFNREFGCAVLVVTHDPRLSARCDRTLTLVDGLIVSDERQPSSG